MNRIKGADSAVADAVEAIPWLRNLMEQTNNRFSQRRGNNRYTMAVAPMNAPTIVKQSQFDMRLLKTTLIHSSRLITDLSIMVRVSKITLFLQWSDGGGDTGVGGGSVVESDQKYI